MVMGFWRTLALALLGWALVGHPTTHAQMIDVRSMCVHRSEVVNCKTVSGLDDDDHRREDRTPSRHPPDADDQVEEPVRNHVPPRPMTVPTTPKPPTDECGPDGDWRSGQATYYASDEPELGYGTGPMGSRDNPLVKGVSVASKRTGDFGRRVCLRGLSWGRDGVYRVDDECRGRGCKDFDVFVGESMGGDEGVDDIQYKWLG